MTLDVKLSFFEHVKNIAQKVSKKIGLLRRFQPILPRSFLLTIYKTFITTHLDFADITYDQAYNSFFHEKLKSLRYNACQVITGAIRITLSKKL